MGVNSTPSLRGAICSAATRYALARKSISIVRLTCLVAPIAWGSMPIQSGRADTVRVCQAADAPLPCQLPGVFGLGNLSADFSFSTWNFQYLGNTGAQTAPISPFGQGQTFSLGYLDVTDPKRPIHFSGTGLATIFIRPEQAAADAPYISEFKLLGDHRNLSLISGEYRLTEPDGAYTIFSAATQRVIYPIQRVNADGKTVWIASYVNGVPKEIKDYRGGTTTYTTDSATGLVTSVTTADGASYQLSYDTQKRLVMVSRFGQMLIKASYQGNTLTEVRDQSGLTSLFSYRDGRLEALAVGPDITTFSYGKTTVTSENKIAGTPVFTTTEYREIETLAGRRWWIAVSQSERVGSSGASTKLWENKLDRHGNVIEAIDSNRDVTLLTRDSAGNVSSVKSLQGTLKIQYAASTSPSEAPKVVAVSAESGDGSEKRQQTFSWDGNHLAGQSTTVNGVTVTSVSNSYNGNLTQTSTTTKETFQWAGPNLVGATTPRGQITAYFDTTKNSLAVKSGAIESSTTFNSAGGVSTITTRTTDGNSAEAQIATGLSSYKANNGRTSTNTSTTSTGSNGNQSVKTTSLLVSASSTLQTTTSVSSSETSTGSETTGDMHIILEPNSNTASKEQGKDQETVEILPVDSNGQSPSGAPANSPTSQNNLAIPPTSPNLAQGNNNNQKQIRAKKDKKKKNKRKKRENKRNNPRNPNK